MVLHLPQPTAAQADLLAGWHGPTLVLGGPGTGKTTLVGLAALACSGKGAEPLVLVPTRAAASGMRNRIAHTLGGTSQPRVTTVHALCRTLLDRFSADQGRRLLTAPEQEFRVRELLGGPGASERWPAALRPALRTRSFARQVRAVLARARQLGLDPADVAGFGASAGAGEWVAVGAFFEEYLDVLDAEGSLDYAELVHRCRILLTDPGVARVVRGEFGAVLVDDLVDFDPAQLGLVGDLVAGSPLLATADPQGAIEGFRGAHPRVVADFGEIFGSPAAPAVTRWLAAGLRQGGDLAAAVARVGERLPQPLAPPPPVPAGPDGRVSVLHCGADEGRAIAAELRRAHAEDGLRWSEMAVLVRQGRAQVPVLQRALAAAGVPVDLAGDDIVLAATSAVRPLLIALEVVARGRAEPSEAELLLGSPLGGLDALGMRQLVRQWRAAQPAPAPALGTQEVLARAVAEPGWAEGRTPQQRRLLRLAGLLEVAGAACAAGARPDEVAWLVWDSSGWPARLREESLRGGAAARHADRDLDAVGAFFDLASETSAGPGSRGIRALLAEVEAQQIPADRERESRLVAHGVQVLTVHRAKGREWPLVVVSGVQEGLWPSLRRPSLVLDAARLTSAGIGLRQDPREHLAAERRLFLVACGRASRHLVVTASVGTGGDTDQPSRFLAELGVPAAAPEEAAPLNLAELVGRLRRVLLEPGASAGEREPAAAVLAELSRRRGAGGERLAPTADPSTWWGVRELSSEPAPGPGQLALSPSQVGDLLTCPRRHFLNRSARAGSPPSMASSLGSVLHLLVQHANTGGLDAADLGSHLDRIWDRLNFEAAWLSSVERAEAEASLGRFLQWRAASPAELVGSEVEFSLSLSLEGLEVDIVGAVDRLERLPDGRLRVVDFKTGRTVPTRAEVEGLDQLGIYQLAVDSGALGDAASGGGTVVYLRHPGIRDDLPKVFEQDPLSQRPHRAAEDEGFPTWVHHRVWQAARVVADGCYPATPGSHCRRCPFADSCPASGRGEQVV